MIKRIILILSITISALNVEADSSWKIHPTFDEEVSHVVDTPRYVYFTSRNMVENEWNDTYFALFRYDKEGDEIISLSTDNYLSGNLISDILYNQKKGYLAILYEDYSIDLLYNDGTLKNIPYYRESDVSYSKNVNGITIEPDKDMLYLATDFGFVAINDKKGEISESRIYDRKLSSFAHISDTFLAINDGKLLYSKGNKAPYDIEKYMESEIPGKAMALYTLENDFFLVKYDTGTDKHISIHKLNDNTIERIGNIEGPLYNVEYNNKGITVTTGDRIYQISADGNFVFEPLPQEYWHFPFSTYNFSDFWVAEKRKGLSELKHNNGEWSVVKDFMLPNSPAVFFTGNFAIHPEKGLLVLTHGFTPVTALLYESIPLQISGYHNGRWTNYSPEYTNSRFSGIFSMPNGIAIDPDNSALVYITSPYNGILRLNLDNPEDIMHLSRANDSDAGNDHFVSILPEPVYQKNFANFSAPRFDAEGNIWMNYADYDGKHNPHLYCWLHDDRLSTTSDQNIMIPQRLEVDVEVTPSNTAFVLPLLKTGKGLLLHVASLYDESVVLIDTNDTPLDSSDDKVYKFPNFIDSDGKDLSLHQIRFAWEDPFTGYVWLGHQEGVCYFNPADVLQGNYELKRIKVSRNDGTNLADYLLEGVAVNQVTVDSSERKWFATNGAGLVCTSSDGRDIITELTSYETSLPDNVVYGVIYNPSSNSLMISTAKGLAEYFLPSTYKESETQQIKAYPNPVRPNFSSYVKITDIPEGSFVKITDIAGNLVKDLGVTNGFEILWDISDMNFKRVPSGVYHILISSSREDGSFSKAGKILVVN